jgi:hypothetical protein
LQDMKISATPRVEHSEREAEKFEELHHGLEGLVGCRLLQDFHRKCL